MINPAIHTNMNIESRARIHSFFPLPRRCDLGQSVPNRRAILGTAKEAEGDVQNDCSSILDVIKALTQPAVAG